MHDQSTPRRKIFKNTYSVTIWIFAWLQKLGLSIQNTHTENEVPPPNYNIISQTRSAGMDRRQTGTSL